MSDQPLTVYLVDDDQEHLKGLQRLLVAEGIKVEAFESSQIFLESIDGRECGCVVLDLAMPGLDGLELQRQLMKRNSVLPIVFLTGQGDVPSSVQAMKGGAVDFLAKPVDGDVLLEAIGNAFARDRALRQVRDETSVIQQRLATLTAREREVLDLVVTGRLNKQIAFDLGTTEKTIKFHRAHVMKKMAARSLADLVRLVDRIRIHPTHR